MVKKRVEKGDREGGVDGGRVIEREGNRVRGREGWRRSESEEGKEKSERSERG